MPTSRPISSPASAPAPKPYYPNGNPDEPYNPASVKNTDSALPLHPKDPVVHDYACDGPAPGSLSFRWIHGSLVAAKNQDPRIQVVQYNEDTFVMRQNVCVAWEAPFTYLLFGNAGALLIDTGATADSRLYPLRATVDAIIERWAKARGRRNVRLTVALTAPENAVQNQGLRQFADRPHTVLVPKPLEVMKRHYGVDRSWPNGTGRIDLGGRAIEVIPTPGAHKDGVSFYDPYCDVLLTGDLVYPGRINIGNDRDFASSLVRLRDFAAANPVEWIWGGHVDMMFVPGKAYPRFATFKPYERALELEPAVLTDLIESAGKVQGKDMVLVRPDFHLLNGVSPDAKTRVWPEGVPNIPTPFPF
jgi:glyoxylase-like metal-dependent hydrolase (beta-lactamase superfamily II)